MELRQANRSAETVEVSRSVSSVGKVLRQKTQVNIGGAELPLSEMSNLAAMMRETTAPITRQKVGRNEPYPCGSGSSAEPDCPADLPRVSHAAAAHTAAYPSVPSELKLRKMA